MKLLFFVALMMSVLVTNIFSQDFTVSIKFNDFENWAKKQNMNGFTFAEASQEGDAEYGESVSYSATFIEGNKMLNLGINEIREFETYKMYSSKMNGKSLTINGKSGYYIPMKNRKASMLVVELKDLSVSFGMMASPLMQQDEMKGYFELLDFSALSSDNSIKWHDEIPADARMQCNVLSLEKQNSSVGAKYEYHVTAVMNDALINDLKRIMNNYGNDLTNIKINDSITFICAEAEDIKSLKDYKRINDEVQFIYYIW